jgi:secondary thiamine-phosphate synthase enzyme
MRLMFEKLFLTTNEPIEIIDITKEVSQVCSKSNIKNGIVVVMTRHTTAAININESEEGLKKDMVSFLNRLTEKEGGYIHDLNAVDGRLNARSHLLSLLMIASVTVPLLDGSMLLGDWQSIFFIELDGPRESREIIIQVMGE